ncbi:hypothetical protein RUND412_010280 [Rhizina undulata]
MAKYLSILALLFVSVQAQPTVATPDSLVETLTKTHVPHPVCKEGYKHFCFPPGDCECYHIIPKGTICPPGETYGCNAVNDQQCSCFYHSPAECPEDWDFRCKRVNLGWSTHECVCNGPPDEGTCPHTFGGIHVVGGPRTWCYKGFYYMSDYDQPPMPPCDPNWPVSEL